MSNLNAGPSGRLGPVPGPSDGFLSRLGHPLHGEIPHFQVLVLDWHHHHLVLDQPLLHVLAELAVEPFWKKKAGEMKIGQRLVVIENKPALP